MSNIEQLSFQERFKDQIQTMGKNGILGTLSNNNSNYSNLSGNNPVKIIHHTAFENNNNQHKGKYLKPINHHKPPTPHSPKEREKVSSNNGTIEDNSNINEISNNPYIKAPEPQNLQNMNYNQNMNQNIPFMYPLPPPQINPYYQPMMFNPYYNNPYYQYYNNGNCMNPQNNFPLPNINLPRPNSKQRLRPISSQSRMNTTNTNTTNLSNLSSGRLCSAQSRSRLTNVEYRPYTLKEYKELEKVGVVLGGLGPNIGTKEWEEKKEKMKKMEEYAKKVAALKEKNKKQKQKVEEIIEKEKKKKIENSIRRRCYEYANLVRPKTRIEQRINRANMLKNNNTSNRTLEKCTIDCDNNTNEPNKEIKVLSKNKSSNQIRVILPESSFNTIQDEKDSLERDNQNNNYIKYNNKDNNNNIPKVKNNRLSNRYNLTNEEEDDDNSIKNLDNIIQQNQNENTNLNLEDQGEIAKILLARENYKKVIDKIKNTL